MVKLDFGNKWFSPVGQVLSDILSIMLNQNKLLEAEVRTWTDRWGLRTKSPVQALALNCKTDRRGQSGVDDGHSFEIRFSYSGHF